MPDDDTYQPIYNRDGLSALLKYSRVTPLRAGVLLAVINVLLNGALAYRSETWFNSSLGMGLLNDYQVLVFALLFQPTVIATFCWFPYGIQRLYKGISKEGVLASELELQHSYEHLRARLQNPWLVPVAVLWGAFSCLMEYIIFFRPLVTSWIQTVPSSYWFHLPLEFLFYMMLALGFYDLIVVLTEVRTIFHRNPIRVQPFHPDRAGGIGAVGRFTANLGYSVGAVGLFLTIVLLQRPPGTTWMYNIMIGCMFAIYFVLAPISFYFPLWSAHNAMLSFRDQHLRAISAEFDVLFTHLRSLRSEEAEKSEALLKRLRQLGEERDLVYRFPVWPFDAASLRKFFGLAFSPLLAIVSNLLLDLLKTWMR